MPNEWGFVEGKDEEIYQYGVDEDGKMHFYKPTLPETKGQIYKDVIKCVLVVIGMIILWFTACNAVTWVSTW